MRFYKQVIIDSMSEEQIHNAYLYQSEQYDMDDIRTYIQTYYSGPYPKSRLLADKNFLIAVLDTYQDTNFDITTIETAIDDVIRISNHTPSNEILNIYRVEETNNKVLWTYYSPSEITGKSQYIIKEISQDDYLKAKYASSKAAINKEKAFLDSLSRTSFTRILSEGTSEYNTCDTFFTDTTEGGTLISKNSIEFEKAITQLFSQEHIKPRLFIDMDGTIARFHDEVQYLERMYEKDFFRNLKPFKEACEAISELVKSNKYEVYILSAAVDGEPPYCRAEKTVWICNNIPEIDIHHHVIFTKVGVPKAAFIPGGIRRSDALLDDYTKNLIEWENSGGIGIKAKNNINCKGLYGEAWNGAIVDICAEPHRIVQSLVEKLEECNLQEHCEELEL